MSLKLILSNYFSHWKPWIALFGDDNFWCIEDLTPDSTTRIDWGANIKSMQEDLSPVMWVGLWIGCSSPNSDVIQSILVVLPRRYHHFLCILKSSKTTTKYEFLRAIESKLSSRLFVKDYKVICKVLQYHCIKHARIPVFTYPYSPIFSHILWSVYKAKM